MLRLREEDVATRGSPTVSRHSKTKMQKGKLCACTRVFVHVAMNIKIFNRSGHKRTNICVKFIYASQAWVT